MEVLLCYAFHVRPGLHWLVASDKLVVHTNTIRISQSDENREWGRKFYYLACFNCRSNPNPTTLILVEPLKWYGYRYRLSFEWEWFWKKLIRLKTSWLVISSLSLMWIIISKTVLLQVAFNGSFDKLHFK